jgi:flagellar motor switch/type III secretory pathway protein FliN
MISQHMASAHPLPGPHGQPALDATAPHAAGGTAADMGLMAVPSGREAAEPIAPNSLAARLPVEVDVAIPVRGFRVRNLLAMGPGELIETQWPHGDDIPLAAGHVRLAWSEFEVIDTQLAVRVTRLA